MNKYYVYIYLDPRKQGKYKYGEYEFEYEPFYVGKGKGKRYNRILGRNKYFINKINKIKELNLNPIMLKYKENLNEKESFSLEQKLIELIGRKDLNKGPLINFTDGGEGMSGYKWTENSLNKLKKNFPDIKNKFNNQGYKLLTEEKDYENSHTKLWYIHKECGNKHSIKWNNFQYGQGCPICVNKNKSIIMSGKNNHFYGKKHSDKTLKLLKEKTTGKNNGMYGRTHSKETKIKISESHLGKYKGVNNPNVKLIESDVILIKMGLIYLPDVTQKELSELFNVHQTCISSIKNGKSWTHIK